MHGLAWSSLDIHRSTVCVCVFIDGQAHVICSRPQSPWVPLVCPVLEKRCLPSSHLVTAKGKTSAIIALLRPTSSSSSSSSLSLSLSPPPLHSPPGSLYHPVLSSLLSLPSSTLSSLLYLYPAATWLSTHRHVFLSSSVFSPLHFPCHYFYLFSPSLWLILHPSHISSSSSPCNLSRPYICLFALSMAELVCLSQFFHLILREMTMLQSAAIISQIKALKLNLAWLKN